MAETVLIAPLNWGLGHATRSVPVIRQYIASGHRVVIAADGAALCWLQKAFPAIKTIRFPGVHIRYSRKSSQIAAMLLQLPGIVFGIAREHQLLKKIIRDENVGLIISDNRFGLWNKSVRSVYITHQIMVKSPVKMTEPLLWRLHRLIIHQYDECWIPDIAGYGNLSGDLAHQYPLPRNAKFIGWLSRFPVEETALIEKKYANLCLISGPEPHRTMFEQAMIAKFQTEPLPTLIIRGKPESADALLHTGNIDLVADMADALLQAYLLSVPNIFCRSGYSTLMDLKALKRTATLFPTPGQTEQEYLATLHAT